MDPEVSGLTALLNDARRESDAKKNRMDKIREKASRVLVISVPVAILAAIAGNERRRPIFSSTYFPEFIGFFAGSLLACIIGPLALAYICSTIYFICTTREMSGGAKDKVFGLSFGVIVIGNLISSLYRIAIIYE